MVKYSFNYTNEMGEVTHTFVREIPESVYQYIESIKEYMIQNQDYTDSLEAQVAILSLLKIDQSQLN